MWIVAGMFSTFSSIIFSETPNGPKPKIYDFLILTPNMRRQILPVTYAVAVRDRRSAVEPVTPPHLTVAVTQTMTTNSTSDSGSWLE